MYDAVRERVEFPFELYPFQKDAVNELADLPRAGLYFDPGLGKTATSTHNAAYKLITGESNLVLVIVPPTLIAQWVRWLGKLRRNGSQFNILTYRGTPAKRKAMTFSGYDFVVMSMQIFKQDIERIEVMTDERTHVILDEAQAVKNVGTANYKTFRDFVADKTYQLLTGTPLNNPLDAYAYIKLVAPTIYKNLAQFERIHVAERDFFKKPTRYANLDLLSENLRVNSVRCTKEEVLTDLPEAIIAPIEYELHPKHAALYKQLAEEQLLKLDDGSKIDATSVQALLHALGQIVCNWAHFGQDESLRSAAFDVLDEVLDELNGNKLFVFANYRMTNAAISKRYNCPAIYGEISAKEKERAWASFVEGDAKLLVAQSGAGGVGLDGAQHVCKDILYIEPPVSLSQYVQSMSRVHREGQKGVATIRFATALGTLQQRMVRSLSQKEDLVMPLVGSKAVLRSAIFGD